MDPSTSPTCLLIQTLFLSDNSSLNVYCSSRSWFPSGVQAPTCWSLQVDTWVEVGLREAVMLIQNGDVDRQRDGESL